MMKDFTKGSVPKLMLAFTLPLLMSNTVQAVYMVIDAMWAGKFLGATGVAIVTTGMPVMFFLTSITMGLIVGASILAGHAFGSKNHELLSDIVSTSAIVSVAASLIISVLGVIFCGPLLRLINTPAPLLHGSQVFLSLMIASIVLGNIGMWFASMLNAAGDSKTPFKILLMIVALNAVLAPVCITGAGLFPPLGIAGPAIATIISNITGVLVSFIVWRGHKLSEIAPFRYQVHFKTLKNIITVGFPLSLQMLVVSSSFLFVLSLANGFGQNVTAAFGIGGRIDQFAFLGIFAVTAAISAMTAQNVGAGRTERVTEITRWGIIYSAGLALVFSAAVMLFPDFVTGLFTKEPAVLSVARHYFWIAGPSYIVLAVLFAYQGVVRGAGDTFASFIIIACTMVFLRVPLCYALSNYTPLKEVGLWLGILVSSAAGAVTFYLYYKSGRWKKKGVKAAVKYVDGTELWSEEAAQAENRVV